MGGSCGKEPKQTWKMGCGSKIPLLPDEHTHSWLNPGQHVETQEKEQNNLQRFKPEKKSI